MGWAALPCLGAAGLAQGGQRGAMRREMLPDHPHPPTSFFQTLLMQSPGTPAEREVFIFLGIWSSPGLLESIAWSRERGQGCRL